jgi:polyferredoxin
VGAALPLWTGRNTLRRRRIQVAFLAVFAVLPVLDLLRFDFGASKLLFFRQEIGLDEWALLWLFLMFAMWVVGAASLVLGRVYCAYACPQTVFTELAHDLDAVASRLTRKLDPKRRKQANRWISLALVGVLSLLASALTMAYFSPLPEVVHRIVHLDVGLWVGAVGFALTVLTFLDLAIVREGFCRGVCPYGLLQGIIEDGRSLHVSFSEQSGACIDCGACERVCPMQIDIRKGPFQIECTRCGSCIDACDGVLKRLKPPRPGLLAFDLKQLAPGAWDLKRGLVAVSTLGFGLALVVAVALRQPVALHVSPVYTQAVADASFAEARCLLRATNRTGQPVTMQVRAEGLPGTAELSGLEDGVLLPGQERRFTLSVKVKAEDVKAGVVPFDWVVSTPSRSQRFAAALLTRGKKG